MRRSERESVVSLCEKEGKETRRSRLFFPRLAYSLLLESEHKEEKMSASRAEPCSHAEAWTAARGGPSRAYLPVQRCLVEEWREARARTAKASIAEVRASEQGAK